MRRDRTHRLEQRSSRIRAGAQGCRWAEAAAVILTADPSVIDELDALVIELDDHTAAVDWLHATQLAERLDEPARTLILLASDLAVVHQPANLSHALDLLDAEQRDVVIAAIDRLQSPTTPSLSREITG